MGGCTVARRCTAHCLAVAMATAAERRRHRHLPRAVLPYAVVQHAASVADGACRRVLHHGGGALK